ncbi:MAG: VanZ family protein [Oscillospiraceae bacterium]|nr:VanZ family protein [Oscillospiraceae bacterium]
MNFFTWFYCLDIPAAIGLVAVTTVAFLHLKARFENRRFWKTAVWSLAAVWLVMVIYLTVMRREPSDTQESAWIPFYSYYLAFTGVNRELLRSGLMNVLLFYPAGVLAVSLMGKESGIRKRAILAAAGCCVLSMLIEISQYVWGLGLAETDDVIHNTVGSFLGMLSGGLPLCSGIKKH